MIAALLLACALQTPPESAAVLSREQLIDTAVAQLIAIQEDGEWPYEGV
jgi:hypothetical protein